MNISYYMYNIHVVDGYATVLFEPAREKTNNLGSDQVRHKAGCTGTEDG